MQRFLDVSTACPLTGTDKSRERLLVLFPGFFFIVLPSGNFSADAFARFLMELSQNNALIVDRKPKLYGESIDITFISLTVNDFGDGSKC